MKKILFLLLLSSITFCQELKNLKNGEFKILKSEFKQISKDEWEEGKKKLVEKVKMKKSLVQERLDYVSNIKYLYTYDGSDRLLSEERYNIDDKENKTPLYKMQAEYHGTELISKTIYAEDGSINSIVKNLYADGGKLIKSEEYGKNGMFKKALEHEFKNKIETIYKITPKGKFLLSKNKYETKNREILKESITFEDGNKRDIKEKIKYSKEGDRTVKKYFDYEMGSKRKPYRIEELDKDNNIVSLKLYDKDTYNLLSNTIYEISGQTIKQTTYNSSANIISKMLVSESGNQIITEWFSSQKESYKKKLINYSDNNETVEIFKNKFGQEVLDSRVMYYYSEV